MTKDEDIARMAEAIAKVYRCGSIVQIAHAAYEASSARHVPIMAEFIRIIANNEMCPGGSIIRAKEIIAQLEQSK